MGIQIDMYQTQTQSEWDAKSGFKHTVLILSRTVYALYHKYRVFSIEAENKNLQIFGLTRLRFEPMTSTTWGEQATT